MNILLTEQEVCKEESWPRSNVVKSVQKTEIRILPYKPSFYNERATQDATRLWNDLL